MSIKKLITIGVFTAIYFMLMFVGGMIGLIGPLGMFLGFTISILLNGPVIMLFFAKTRTVWALPIMGLLMSTVMSFVEHPWYGVPIVTVLGLLGGLIAKTGNFVSPLRNALGYGVFTFWYLVPWLPFFIDSASYLQMVKEQMGAEYMTAFEALITPGLLLGWGVLAGVIGFIGGIIGMRMMRKHFVKAGVAA